MDDATLPAVDAESLSFYDHDAQWYAACSGEWLQPQRQSLATMLPSSLAGQVVVDIGAGVGAMLSVFAELGATDIYAVEPSAGMQVGLTTHVALTAQLAQSTTILPGSLPEVLDYLPNQWDVVTFLNVHGHLTATQEHQLWHLVAERLAPGGQFIVGLQPPATATAVPETSYGAMSIGKHVWTMSGYAEPLDNNNVTWYTTRSVSDVDGTIIRGPHTTSCAWRVSCFDDLVKLAKTVGLEYVDRKTGDSTTPSEENMFAFTKPEQ